MPELPSDKAKNHPWTTPSPRRRVVAPSPSPYAELQVTSNFSFLRGASHPDELATQAAAIGLRAIAITDRSTLAGIVRAHVAAKQAGVQLIVGSRVDLAEDTKTESAQSANSSLSAPPSLSVLLYPTDRAAYARLCRLLTRGKRRAPKGECFLTIHDLVDFQEGLLAVVVPPQASPGIAAPITDRFIESVEGLSRVFGDRLSLAVSRLYTGEDDDQVDRLAALSAHTGVPLVATNDVHYHVSERRALQDVVTCIRHGTSIDRAGSKLFPNGERYLKDGAEMSRLFVDLPEAVSRSVEIAERVRFDLDELKYQYPDEVCPPGMSADAYLRALVYRGAEERFGEDATKGRSVEGTKGSERIEPNRIFAVSPRSLRRSVAPSLPPHLSSRLEHELTLIAELNYATYFLTVYDIVSFARSQGILCQGRGAAANSAVCYCLGITSVDPERVDMLFERFVSKERDEPPDIDVDFEHERREEVIQHIYAKYGRDRAALTAEVISYRGRSAVREVGKAMGLSLDAVDRLARQLDWWDKGVVKPERVRELGLDPDDPTVQMTLRLTDEILGFPRHLSQHVGGFVITQGLLEEMVPIENAAMEDRTVIEWDKDDIDAMGMLKVDCLGLGMLTCIRKALEFVNGSGEATKRRSDEGAADGETRHEGVENEKRRDDVRQGQNVSGSDCLAEGDGSDESHLLGDERDAAGRAIWTDDADPSCGGLGAVEHRGRTRPSEPSRLRPLPATGEGLTRRTGHTVGNRVESENAQRERTACQSDPRDRQSAPRSDPQPRKQTNLNAVPLRRFVASSLRRYELHTVPPEDPTVYDMICAADTVGVFQIESRAQMSMLPRLRPRCYYDLVIEVAIVRPGPIQGKMVHPYLRRRCGEEPVTYPGDEVKGVLERTLGVPLFQEQAMQLAVVAAGFTPGEADQLRRAMATWKRKGDAIGTFEDKFISGMLERGYDRNFADRCFEQIRGFGLYGFPESHAASFALLVYVSAWLKCHHPAAFAAALINSQPMGFYAPAQIVRDAKEHGVEVLEVDVNLSGWDCRLEERDGETEKRRDEVAEEIQSNDRKAGRALSPALRLGMRLVRGLAEEDARAIEETIDRHGQFNDIESLWRTSGVPAKAFRALASADAFQSMGLDRRQALWEVRALLDESLPLFDMAEETHEPSPTPSLSVSLPALAPDLDVAHDYATVGLSLKAHPMSFFRERLTARGVRPAEDLRDAKRCPQNRRVSVAGIVLMRQRPSTASGIVFMTLEDETGIANLIIRPRIYLRFRKAARHGVCLIAHGHIERQGEVVHLIVHRVEDMHDGHSPIRSKSRDFH